MRKKLISILLIVLFLMVVIHELIPHHHHEMDNDIELFSHQQHKGKQDNNSETGTNNHLPIPAHHHVSSSKGFDLARVGTGLERNDISPFCFLIPSHLLYIPDEEPSESTFYSHFSEPHISHPFIISPNAMRGSPSIA